MPFDNGFLDRPVNQFQHIPIVPLIPPDHSNRLFSVYTAKGTPNLHGQGDSNLQHAYHFSPRTESVLPVRRYPYVKVIWIEQSLLYRVCCHFVPKFLNLKILYEPSLHATFAFTSFHRITLPNYFVEQVGFEPTIFCLQNRRISQTMLLPQINVDETGLEPARLT